MLFAEDLEEIAARVPGFTLHWHYFYRYGPLDERFLRERCPDFARRRMFVCGPPPLLALARSIAHRAGVPGASVEVEEFDLL